MCIRDRKRDALISEFFTVIEDVDKTREEVEEKLFRAFRVLIAAEGLLGVSTLRDISRGVRKEATLRAGVRSVMGVRLPVFEVVDVEKDTAERGYGVAFTSSVLDRTVKEFEEALALIVELAEIEESARRLAEEINKTKRKVNALEYILIPKLKEKANYIESSLEEMERENFSRLKLIKSRITE